MDYLVKPINSNDVVKPDSVQADPGPVAGCSIYWCPWDWAYGGRGDACQQYCASFCPYSW